MRNELFVTPAPVAELMHEQEKGVLQLSLLGSGEELDMLVRILSADGTYLEMMVPFEALKRVVDLVERTGMAFCNGEEPAKPKAAPLRIVPKEPPPES